MLVAPGATQKGNLTDLGKRQIEQWAETYLPAGVKMLPTVRHDGSTVAQETARIIGGQATGFKLREEVSLGMHRITGDHRLPVPNFSTVEAFCQQWDLASMLRSRLMAWLLREVSALRHRHDLDTFQVVGVGNRYVIPLLAPDPKTMGFPGLGDGLRYHVVLEGTDVRVLSCTPLENPLRAS